MIYPRLKVAKDLLSEDGVIFISIDDNEVENLKKVCDEVFGERNSQALITYVRKTSGKQDSSNFMKSTEYIVVYSKTDKWECQPLIADTHVTDRYNKTNNEGRAFRETDLRKTGNADRREDRPLMFYPFYFNPSNNELIPSNIERPDLKSKGYIEIFPIKPDGTDGRWRWGIDNAKNNVDFLVAREMPKYKGKFTVYEIDYIDKKGEIRTVKEHTSWDRKDFNSDNAMAEFKKLGFSNQLFPFPKSSALIKHIAFLADTPNSVVLDFFSGSATTAHAVMQLNAEDGGNRKFIMVQLPEATDEKSEAYKAGYKNICEIGKERIRRAGKKIVEELEKKKVEEGLFAGSSTGTEARPLDIGFRVLKLDSSNMQDVYYSPEQFNENLLFEDNIKHDRTDEDLLFQAMIELGIELSAKIEQREIAGKTVWSVADNYLMACFDKDVNETAITEIARQHPYYCVLRDSSLATDNVADNFEQIWEEYSKETVRRII
jgi:adenine-specific DNA-methyltransferase